MSILVVFGFLLMCYLLLMHHLLPLRPLFQWIPLLSSFFVVVIIFVDVLIIILLLFMLLLFFWNRHLIVMHFLIRNGSTLWLRRLQLLSALTHGILFLVLHM